MSQPQPALCGEREEIAQSIRVVLNKILSLHRAELDVAKKGDLSEVELLGKEREKAMVLEKFLLNKLEAHIQSHGCRQPKVLL